jgi:hypothetical protein
LISVTIARREWSEGTGAGTIQISILCQEPRATLILRCTLTR